MRKKITLQRNFRRGRRSGTPHLRYLVIAAVCLIFLVLLSPYLISLLKGKSNEGPKRPIPEMGTITKEVPKQVEPSTPERFPEPPNPTVEVSPAPVEPAITPGAIKPAEIKPQPPEPSPTVAQGPHAGQTPAEGQITPPPKPAEPTESVVPPPKPAKPAESVVPAPKDLFPKKKSASVETHPRAPKNKPATKETGIGRPVPAAKPAPSAKPAQTPAKEGSYAVQIGPAFDSRSNAEKIVKEMAEKGYKAVVHNLADGSGYFVATSPSQEGKAYTLLEQMKMQGVSEAKVITVPPTPKPAKKPAPKKKASPERKDKP